MADDRAARGAGGQRQLAGLVRAVESARPARSRGGAASTLTAKDAGLEPPTATVTLTDKDGKTYTLEVGQKVVMSSDHVRAGRRRAGHSRGGARPACPQVDQEPRDFRLQQLIRFKPDEATHVQVEHAGQTYQFSPARTTSGSLTSAGRRLKRKLRGEAAHAAEHAAGSRCVDESPATQAVYGFDEPFMTVNRHDRAEAPKPAPATQPDGDARRGRGHHPDAAAVIGGAPDLKSERRYVQDRCRPVGRDRPPDQHREPRPEARRLRDPHHRVKATDIHSSS